MVVHRHMNKPRLCLRLTIVLCHVTLARPTNTKRLSKTTQHHLTAPPYPMRSKPSKNINHDQQCRAVKPHRNETLTPRFALG